MAYYEGNINDLSTGCGNNNGWANDWSWIIGLIAVAGLFGGGFGNGGLFGNRGSNCATQADLSAGFSTSEIMSDLNDILLGQAQMQNFINQGFAGLNQTVNTVGSNLSNAICTLGYQNQAQTNQISNLIQSCCCDLKQINLENRYLNEKQTCEIVNAINSGNQRLVDIYTSDKISALQTENASLKGQISNDRQSRFIIDSLAPKCPQPAYVVQPPQEVTFPTNCCGNVAYANYNNSGCGCC